MTLTELKAELLSKVAALGEGIAQHAQTLIAWIEDEETTIQREIGHLTAHGYTVTPPQ